MLTIVIKLIIIESLQLITIGRIDGLLRQFAEQIHWRPKGLKGQHQMTYHLHIIQYSTLIMMAVEMAL